MDSSKRDWGCAGAVALVLGAFGSTGCGLLGGSSGTDDPINTTPAVDNLEIPGHPGLESCTAGVAAADVEDTLELARDARQSFHEMIVCGGLQFALIGSVIGVLANAAAGSSTSASGLVFDGQGNYQAGTQMDLQLHLGFGTSFGANGDLIGFDALDLANYATGFSVSASASVGLDGLVHTSFGLEFTNPGPGLELLGLGPNPASPVQIDLDAVAAAVGQHQLAGTVHTQSEGAVSTIDYALDTPGTPLASVTDGGSSFTLTTIVGVRPDNNQALSATKWSMKYAESHAAYLDGTIEIDVTGGAFDYHVQFVYPHRKEPDVFLSCLP